MKVPSEDLLEQFPGLVCCFNKQNEFIYLNERGAKIFGFENPEQSLGTTIQNIPCKVSEYAPVFEQQNRMVVEKNLSLKLVDIHPFANDEMLTMIVNKRPLAPSFKTEGVIVYGTPITRTHLLNVSLAAARADKKFRPNGNINHRSYQFDKKFKNLKLSKRELECLFYLIRGKSVADVSQLLQLSKRTVESYLENMKFKLNCKSKAELIEFALDNNFIDFIPEDLLSPGDHLSVIVDTY